MAAGASFIVAPGFDPEVCQHVIDKGGIMMPGTATAGEMQQDVYKRQGIAIVNQLQLAVLRRTRQMQDADGVECIICRYIVAVSYTHLVCCLPRR